jgi:acetylglutamate kinase
VREFGGKAVGISGKRVFHSRKLPPQLDGKTEVDLGFVGEVERVELGEVQQAVAQEIVPVISPLGSGDGGHALNVNADIGAGSLAGALRASKLIYLSDVPGVMRNREQADSLIPSINRATVRKLIADEIIVGGMIPKVTSAVKAIDAGVGAVHFIDGRLPHSLLLEIFTTDGVGTEILA